MLASHAPSLALPEWAPLLTARAKPTPLPTAAPTNQLNQPPAGQQGTGRGGPLHPRRQAGTPGAEDRVTGGWPAQQQHWWQPVMISLPQLGCVCRYVDQPHPCVCVQAHVCTNSRVTCTRASGQQGVEKPGRLCCCWSQLRQ